MIFSVLFSPPILLRRGAERVAGWGFVTSHSQCTTNILYRKGQYISIHQYIFNILLKIYWIDRNPHICEFWKKKTTVQKTQYVYYNNVKWLLSILSSFSLVCKLCSTFIYLFFFSPFCALHGRAMLTVFFFLFDFFCP